VSSAHGIKLAASNNQGQVYTSRDSGVTWTPNASPSFFAMASSADGSKLVGANAGGAIYTSADTGASWAPLGPSGQWRAVASSALGDKLVAVASPSSSPNPGGIYTFTTADGGATWTQTQRLQSNQPWSGVASSADGSKLVAVVQDGYVYTSADSGATWTQRDSPRPWRSVTSSADGNHLVAVVFPGQIYVSDDSGVTWTARESSRYWASVASSADGSTFAATGIGVQIYVSIPVQRQVQTTIGLTGSISGTQYQAMELQYMGGGMFDVLSASGAGFSVQ
jgi:photosystem II stability/assembly factor-like uncharacterized protein